MSNNKSTKYTDKALEQFNHIKNTTSAMWEKLPPGIQKNLLKDEEIKKDLIYFGIIQENEASK